MKSGNIESDKKERNNNNLFVKIFLIFLLLIILIPILFIISIIVIELEIYSFFTILLAIIFIPIIGMGLKDYWIKRFTNKAPRLTIKKFLDNVEKENIAVIKAKIKKTYPTAEEAISNKPSETVIGASNIGLGFQSKISHERDYLIYDDTDVIKLKNAPVYPKYETDQEIIALCRARKVREYFYLDCIKLLDKSSL